VVDAAIEVRPGVVSSEPEPDKIYDISNIDFDRLRKEFERSPAKRTTVQNLREVVEKRLKLLLSRNPLRTDFQQHYEQIISEYNKEKNRATIEQTFEELFKLDQELGEEERRAVREGLDEESLAIFDLLRRPDLSAKEIKRIKKVSVELLRKLKDKIKEIDHWRDRETTRDAVKVEIYNFLYSDATGLPEDLYTEDDVEGKTDEVFHHVYRAYPTIPSPVYDGVAA
jgi:type I restriction enzyme R subunit